MSLASFQRSQLLVIPEARFAIMMTPKVANTSIRFALHHTFGLEDADRKITTKRYRHDLNPVDWRPHEYLNAVFVRCPWDRLRSCYTDKIVRSRPDNLRADLKRIGCRTDMSLEEFAEAVAEATDDETIDKHLKPQHHLVRSELWAGARKLVLRYERLAEEWSWLRDALEEHSGWLLPPRLERHNASRVRRPEWTHRAVNLVARRYEEDIRLLGYSPPC